MGVMFFLRRSSEEHAKEFDVGLISQVPLAFWKRATMPATEESAACRRYCGEVVPMPTRPSGSSVIFSVSVGGKPVTKRIAPLLDLASRIRLPAPVKFLLTLISASALKTTSPGTATAE